MRSNLCRLILALTILACLAPAARSQPGADLDQFIARTAEVLEWATDIVRESDNEQAHRVLERARSLHEQSLQQRAAGHPRLALASSRQARTAAEQAARLARESRGLEERARQRLERYQELHDQLLDRAREAQDRLALRFIEESEQHAQRSRDQFRQQNFEMALNLLEPAEELLARAARLLFEAGGSERLDRELERAQILIERTEQRLGDGASAEARDLLQSAREALARAVRFKDEGQILRSLQSLRVAIRLATQAGLAAGEPISADTVREQIQRWDERHEEVAEHVRESGSREAAQLMDRARHHREQADRLLQEGSREPALRQIKAAFDLLNEASELSR